MQADDRVDWERAPGISQISLVRGRLISHAGYALKRIGLEKMAGVRLISAEFKGDLVLFEHRASVLVDSGRTAHFCGAYETAPSDHDMTQTPQMVCLRYASYDRDADYVAFARAPDKQEYVLGGQMIDADIRFCGRSDAAPVSDLIERAGEMILAGMPFEHVDRSHGAVGGLTAMFDVANVHCELFFVPTSKANRVLDDWVNDWEASFANMTSYAHVAPDGGKIRVSYNNSLFDRISRVVGRGAGT